jgi:hypothetical protein
VQHFCKLGAKQGLSAEPVIIADGTEIQINVAEVSAALRFPLRYRPTPLGSGGAINGLNAHNEGERAGVAQHLTVDIGAPI